MNKTVFICSNWESPSSFCFYQHLTQVGGIQINLGLIWCFWPRLNTTHRPIYKFERLHLKHHSSFSFPQQNTNKKHLVQTWLQPNSGDDDLNKQIEFVALKMVPGQTNLRVNVWCSRVVFNKLFIMSPTTRSLCLAEIGWDIQTRWTFIRATCWALG